MSRARLREPVQPRRRVVTPDEVRVWRAIAQEAKPLPGRVVPDEPVNPGPEAKPSPPLPPGSPPPRPSAHAPVPKPLHRALELAHGRSPGLDRRSADRMKRGEMEIEASVDLHGMTQEAAHGSLIAFIQQAWTSGKRCVLVVTGKGKTGEGVLRAQAPRWLNQSPLRERVLGFCHARPQHGGDGALYVLVRRQRG